MLNLKKSDRDEIVRALNGQMVLAPVGAILMQISQILMNLPEVPEPTADAEKPKEKKA